MGPGHPECTQKHHVSSGRALTLVPMISNHIALMYLLNVVLINYLPACLSPQQTEFLTGTAVVPYILCILVLGKGAAQRP